MKKIPFFKLILPLIFVFLALSCIFSYLKHEVSIDDEVAQLMRHVPSAKSPPDAGIIYILDEDIVEVSEDGRCKETFHVVFKILNARAKIRAILRSVITPAQKLPQSSTQGLSPHKRKSSP